MFRFAIMGAGGIANKFCEAVTLLDNCEVVAISSKSIERAQDFALRHCIPSAYDSYEEMLQKEDIDCVYIAVTHNFHYELCMLCLDYQTPILCEKSMVMTSTHAKEIFNRSKELGVFVMEAMWSRFLPTINQAKQWLLEDKIGTPIFLDISFGFLAPFSPDNRLFNPALGGGVSYDIGVYTYEIATYMFSDPICSTKISVIFGETGVDTTTNIILQYENAIASLKSTLLSPMGGDLIIFGTKGKMIVPNSYNASEIFVYNEKDEEIEHYVDTITRNGFTYEIEEAIRCIGEGLIESPTIPHYTTIQCSELFDEIMKCNPANHIS